MTSAFGKIILLGEHAVVYGQPALAGAVNCPLTCELALAGSGPLRLRVPAWQLDITSADDHPVAVALRALIDALGAHALSGTIEIATSLPAGAGLGSSAALSVALVRTMANALGKHLSAEDIEAAADHAERCFHKNPSGVDVALATRGGLGLYRRGAGLVPVRAAPFALAVGLSGQPRRTADMVARVAEARAANPAHVDRQLGELGDAAAAGAEACARGDLAALGTLMAGAHAILASLGVSTATLDDMVACALDAGALGAKLTGGGGGGAVIALTGPASRPGHDDETDRAQAVLAAWKRRGFDGFVCHVGTTT